MGILLLLLLATTAFGANTLTPSEKRSGWMLLFDGRSLDGWWWSTATPPPVPCWKVEAGLLQTAPGQGAPTYLLTRDSFEDFEMALEWKTERGGNSGVKYRFQGFWKEKE